MKKLGLVALGFLMLAVEGCEKACKLAEKKGEDLIEAYKATEKMVDKEYQESQK